MNDSDSDFHPATWFGPIKGWHVALGFVLFFGIVFTANGALIYNAISGFDGLEQEDAYRKGRAYNHVIDDMAAQQALGWTSSISTAPLSPATTAHATKLSVRMLDAEGNPLTNLKIHATFWRPVMQGSDERATLVQTEPGLYQGGFNLAFGGNWEVRIAAEDTSQQRYAISKRLNLP